MKDYSHFLLSQGKIVNFLTKFFDVDKKKHEALY